MSEEFDLSKEFMELHDDFKPETTHSHRIKKKIDDDDEDTYENEDDDMLAIMKSKKSKKKAKKKEKKKKFRDDKMDLLMEDINMDDSLSTSDNIMMDEDDDYLIFKKTKKGKKKDLFDVKEAKKKRKKNIEAKFAPQLTELRKILKDTDDAAGIIKEILQDIRGSKSRYVGKTLTDLLQALNSANSNRASVVRDISNINKTIIDLGLKKDKLKPDKKDSDVDNEEYGINLFSRLLGATGGGRKGLMDDAREYYNSNIQDDGYDGYDPDAVIEDRLANEENEYRTSTGDKYIEYENEGAEDGIMLHADGTWETDAIDKYRQRMPDDYPRINKEDIGEIYIDKDAMMASDRYGRKFPVIEIP